MQLSNRKNGRGSGGSRTAVGAVAVVVGLVLATAPAQAAPTRSASAQAGTMAAALQRDLGLTPGAAVQRLAQEQAAARAGSALSRQLGSSYAGSYVTPGSGVLTVAVTDAAQAPAVRSAGAEPVVVERSADSLGSTQGALDAAAVAGSGVTSSYVDPVTNAVVLTVAPGAGAAADRQVAAAGVDPAAVRVVETSESPRPLAAYRGGDRYYIDSQYVCSVGFAVRSSSGTAGFVTAGHCGAAGDSVTNSSNQAAGTFRASSFPGNDYSWVATTSSFTGTGVVAGPNGAGVAVQGSTAAAVGASVCRSGQTTGWHCGTIQSKNQSVYYSEGTVSGLTRTTACAEGGDSGGSWMSGNQAQGTTSGGSGDCTSGGTTYFQPVGEILSAYGLTLLTS